MRIYKAELKPISQDELNKILNGSKLSDRIGKCPECDGESFWVYPKESNAVRVGGKPYCECMECGYITHL